MWTADISDDNVLTIYRNGIRNRGTIRIDRYDDEWHLRWISVHLLDFAKRAVEMNSDVELNEVHHILKMLSDASLTLANKFDTLVTGKPPTVLPHKDLMIEYVERELGLRGFHYISGVPPIKALPDETLAKLYELLRLNMKPNEHQALISAFQEIRPLIKDENVLKRISLRLCLIVDHL